VSRLLLIATCALASTTCSHTREADQRKPASGAPSRAASATAARPAPPSHDATPHGAATGASLSCKAQPFARSIDLPEASGATYLDGDAPSLLVVGDSGTRGAYLLLDPDSGDMRESGRLPLDKGASDDLEGVSVANDIVYAITSSGWMREFDRTKDGFRLRTKSYPLARRDADELVCKDARRGNCAQNYEGLCLTTTRPEGDRCAGFAAAKASGRLFCLLSDEDGHLRIDRKRTIEVAAPEALTGCHFDEHGRLWFGTNTFGLNVIGLVRDWQTPARSSVQNVGSVGIGFPEAIATAPGERVYRFSDTAGSPSLLGKYICR
jgi:hypothetical protein